MNEAAPKNVVMMSQFDNRRGSPAASEVQLLNDCRDMAVAGMAQALSKMMDRAVDEFFSLSEQSLHHEMRNLYMDAMSLARDQRAVIEGGFKFQFSQSFNREVRGERKASQTGKIELGELSLVDPDDLEESLAAINIANGIHDDCGEELFGLEKRMGALLHDPELTFRNNPLGPDVIGKSFVGAMKELNCPVKVKLLLVTLFSKYMPRQIKGVYQDVNQYLVDKGVLEKIRVGARRRPGSSGAPAAGADRATAEAPADDAASSGETGLFAALQQLLTQGAAAPMPVPGGMGGGLGGSVPVAIPEQSLAVLGALTQLQRGHLEGLAGAGALDAAVIGDGHTNVLREIKATPIAGTMGQMDAMTLDIVAMLFDYILDDKRIPDALKALIGRLQIPVLKVAMVDKAFFSQKQHPARKLLDRLAEVAIGWDQAEGHEGGLYKRIDDLVQRILNEFDDKVGIFSEVKEELEQYLAEEKRRADELTGLTAQALHRQEQAEIAKIMAHDEIKRRIHAPHMSEVILEFLVGSWERVLVAAYTRAGEDGDPWVRALETMDDLIWSVAPKSEVDDRKKLVALLPGLLRRLQQGMAQAGLADAERDRFFAKLVRCHADAVKSGLQPVSEERAAQAAFVVQAFEAEDAAELAQADAEAGSATEFKELDVPEGGGELDPAIAEKIAAEPEDDLDAGWQTLTIGDQRWQRSAGPEGDDYDAMVRRLKRGTWIEFDHDNGETARVKLAWVSPLKGLFLFTNRRGERAVSITPAGLATKFRGGLARVIDDIALVDRAVNSLMERLKGTATLPI